MRMYVKLNTVIIDSKIPRFYFYFPIICLSDYLHIYFYTTVNGDIYIFLNKLKI
jgi:hypothetical protein